MAQTVALDHYAESVERMIVSFMGMNMKIEKTGNFDLLNKKDLYKLVASNNTVITNVLSKVRSHLLRSVIFLYIFLITFHRKIFKIKIIRQSHIILFNDNIIFTFFIEEFIGISSVVTKFLLQSIYISNLFHFFLI